MRLFLAADLDGAARAAAVNTVAALAPRAEAAGLAVRWMPPEQLHFTLRFLGEVEAPAAATLAAALAGPWKTAAFQASLAGLDLFPYSGAPRVVWVGMDEGREQLLALKTELDERLAPLGFAAEDRPFRVHLTLGRLKRNSGASSQSLRSLLGECAVESARWVVDRVALYESRVSFRGASYRVVDSVSLPAPDAGRAR